MNSENLVHALGALIVEIDDGRQGFKLLAEDCHEPELKALLYQFVLDCTETLGNLRICAATFDDAEPLPHGSTSETVRHQWVGTKSAVISDRTLTVLEGAANGYARIEAAFAKVLDCPMPSVIRDVLEQEKVRVARNPERLAQVGEVYAAIRPETEAPVDDERPKICR